MTEQGLNEGWIGLYRSIIKHWIYPKDRPFTKYEAWVDLLLTVNYEQKKVFTGEYLISCDKGEIITSQLKLMKRWKWSKSKLLKFFSVLENDEMCTVKSDNKKTSIKVCNYIGYQDFKEISKNKKTAKKTVDHPTERLQKDTTKEYKEDISFNFYAEEVKKAKEFTDQMSLDYISLCNHICKKDKESGEWLMPFVLKIDKQISLDNFSKLYEKAEGRLDSITSKIDSIQNKVAYHNQYTNLYLTINTWLNNK